MPLVKFREYTYEKSKSSGCVTISGVNVKDLPLETLIAQVDNGSLSISPQQKGEKPRINGSNTVVVNTLDGIKRKIQKKKFNTMQIFLVDKVRKSTGEQVTNLYLLETCPGTSEIEANKIINTFQTTK